MSLKYDGSIDVAVGHSATTKVWKNTNILYSDFVTRMSTSVKTSETFKEYLAASKADQLAIKDVGGYCGGYLTNGKRSPSSVAHRQLVTLDIDFAHGEMWDDFCLMFDNAALIHSTHKHSDANPRYRLILPLSREVSPDEYAAISRKIAGMIGIELFDNTTFETNRLMFWASNPKDINYYFKKQDGPWIDADEILDMYLDWKDTSAWPTSDAKINDINQSIKKQEDPTTKRGIIGSFCRAFSLTEAITEFLADVYVTTAVDDRFTYVGGSTSAGLIVYDDMFAYSFHSTDPCNNTLNNAFDLVRRHKFGHLDSGKSESKPASMKAMEDFAAADPKVKMAIAKEIQAKAKLDFTVGEVDFDDDYDSILDVENVEGDGEDYTWMKALECDAKGQYASNSTNVGIILEHDSRIKHAFRLNEFNDTRYVSLSKDWKTIKAPRPLGDDDYSNLRIYLDRIYKIVCPTKIDDALAEAFRRNAFHPVKEYLDGLKWDGVKRIDTTLIEYFGADDNIYTREALRKSMTAAVARIYQPGIKFDLVLTLVGPQGAMKSTFLSRLGKSWFSDAVTTVLGKEAIEQTQSGWILELAELASLKKADVESIKHFISKQEDRCRPAYGRTTVNYPRQCVFFGTTNTSAFLVDPTGNRRFMPIDINPNKTTKHVYDEFKDAAVDQLWAEAVTLYRSGEALTLSNAALKIANGEQMAHAEESENKGIIEAYLDAKIPANWESMDVYDRRIYLDSGDQSKGVMFQDEVCTFQICEEALRIPRDRMTRAQSFEIAANLKSLGWEPEKTNKKIFLGYGRQRYFVRPIS